MTWRALTARLRTPSNSHPIASPRFDAPPASASRFNRVASTLPARVQRRRSARDLPPAGARVTHQPREPPSRAAIRPDVDKNAAMSFRACLPRSVPLLGRERDAPRCSDSCGRYGITELPISISPLRHLPRPRSRRQPRRSGSLRGQREFHRLPRDV